MSSARPSRFALAFNFGLVYLFWGSTYLGIDIAVEHIPPALMCATRFTIAGVIMLAYCLVRGQSIRRSGRELLQLAIVGNLLLMGGNLTLAYSERYIPSGLAALLVASIPIWFLILDALLIGHHRLSARALGGLALGFTGTFVLLLPKLSATGGLGNKELLWSIALLLGSFSWAFGSVLSKKWQSGPPTFAGTAWQVFFAGLGNSTFALLNRDVARVIWTPRGIGAVAYLVVGGSLIGYTAYIYILGHAPAAKVSTYAYVNPVVAVFLGWLVLHEKVDGYILAGSAIIVAAVVLVTSASVSRKTSDQLEMASTAAD
ncbi:MAG TPA: EamA family transporter [Terriglobales bacterium]|nr:EamA family transporter [Terriglobales bacterium]